MMKFKRILYNMCIVSGMALLLASCKYDTKIAHPEKYVSIYMPQAANGPVSFDFQMSDTVQTVIYGANYGGIGYPDKNITVNFSVDTSLVDSFNLKNGTTYLPMPSGSYSLEAVTAEIPKGKLSTNPLALTIKTEGAIDPSIEYMLPISILDDNGVKISGNLKTTYFIIEGLYAVDPNDAYNDYDRSVWKVSGFDSQDDHYVAANVLDDDPATFWSTQYKGGQPGPPHWISIEMDTIHLIHGFYFFPRVGWLPGNPVDISIGVSKDNKTWTSVGSFTLDVVGRQNVYLQYAYLARYFKVTITGNYANKFVTNIAEVGSF